MFGRKKALWKKAGVIIHWARCHATTLFHPLATRYPALDEIVTDLQDWDRIVTVASVGSACFVAEKHNAQRAQELRMAVREQLRTEGGFARIEKDLADRFRRPFPKERLRAEGEFAVAAFDDLCTFVYSGPGAKIDREMAPGWWILWNIKGSDLCHDERELGLRLGVILSGQWVQQDLVDLT